MTKILQDKIDSELCNSGTRIIGKRVKTDSLKIDKTFASLIPIDEFDLIRIENDMKKNGYDESCPIHVWKHFGIIVDGMTRFKAALNSNTPYVVIHEHEFENEYEAISYCLKAQTHRRNLSESARLRLLEQLDKRRKQRGRSLKRDGSSNEKGKSANELASLLHVSPRTIERYRAVLKRSDFDNLQKIDSGEMSINQAYEALQKKKGKKEMYISMINWERILSNESLADCRDKDFYSKIMACDIRALSTVLSNIQSMKKLSVSQWYYILEEN